MKTSQLLQAGTFNFSIRAILLSATLLCQTSGQATGSGALDSSKGTPPPGPSRAQNRSEPSAPVGLAEALDTETLVWNTGGQQPWFGQTNVTHDGLDAAQTGELTGYGETWLETSVTGPGLINFWWKTSTIQDYYFLSFKIDGNPVTNITGQPDWRYHSFSVPSGPHTLRWDYSRYDEETDGLDAGWLDEVVFLTNSPAGPTIATPPQSVSATAGDDVVFEVVPQGTEPFNYQWRLNGADLSGETGQFLRLLNVQSAQSGLYSVTVGNMVTETASAPATLTVHPSPVVWKWACSEGGTGNDAASAVTIDGAGNLYAGGRFNGVASFGTNIVISTNSSDLFVAKYDSRGSALWARQIRGPNTEWLTSLGTDTNGHLYVAGLFYGSITVGETTLESIGLTGFAAKFDGDGTALWAVSFGHLTQNTPLNMGVTRSGEAYLLGTLDCCNSPFGDLTVSNAGVDIFLAKLDPDGTFAWAQSFGTTNWDQGRSLAVDSAGQAYFSGQFYGTLLVGTNVLVGHYYDWEETDFGVFMAKCDADGNVFWAHLGETNYYAGYDLAVDNADHLYARCHFYGTTTLGTNLLVAREEGSDCFVARLTPEGQVLWAKPIAHQGFGSTGGYRLATDEANHVYVMTPFVGTSVVDGKTLFSIPGALSLLAAFDEAGALLWTQKLPGYTAQFAPDARGNVYVCGSFIEPINVGTYSLLSRGRDDVFLANLEAVETLCLALQPPDRSMSTVQVQLLGLRGRGPVSIEVSTNLADWTVVTTNSVSEEWLNFSCAPGQPAHFYRARLMK